MGKRHVWRATALVLAGAAALVLSACTPSGYAAEKGTVVYQARRLGMTLSSSQVSCKPKPNADQTRHLCTAPVGPGGKQVELQVESGWIITSHEKTEVVHVSIPASYARGSLAKSNPGWTYYTVCGWHENAQGKWVVDTAQDTKCHHYLRNQYGEIVSELP